MRKHLYHRETFNGKSGHSFMVANNWSNRLNLRAIQNTTVKRNVGKLDVGAQGALFVASMKRRVPPDSQFVIKICPYDPSFKGGKQVLDIEWAIQKKLYEVVPRHIPKVLAPLIKCQNFMETNLVKTRNMNSKYDYTKQNIMCSEYIRNGNLLHYLQAMANSPRKRLTDDVLKSFIFQVLNTLKKIRAQYPKFIHMDLHFGNIFVKYGHPYPIMVLADFGWSKIDDSLANPLIAKGSFADRCGIGPKTTDKYDTHLFLNEFRRAVIAFKAASKDGWPQTMDFLNRVVPPGYRDETDTYTRESRLRYDMPYPGLPNLDQILADPYLTGANSPKNRVSPWKPGRAASPPKAKAKSPNRPAVEPKPLAPSPKVLSNTELKALSAGGFMRLTPLTKARAIALRKKNEPKKVNVLKFNTTRKSPSPKRAAPARTSPVRKVTIPRNVLKDPRFNRLAVTLMSPVREGENAGASYERWNRAVAKARKQIENRLRNNKPAFSPGTEVRVNRGAAALAPRQNLKLPKRPKPVKNVKRMGPSSPPKGVREPIKQPKPKKPIVVTNNNKNGKNKKAIKSPGGRIKVLGNSGRYAYAESKSLEELRRLAANMKVNVSGLKLKKNIAQALFSAA
jgi:hypothetical protein